MEQRKLVASQFEKTDRKEERKEKIKGKKYSKTES